MEVSKQALQNIISDEERLLFAENIPAEYLSDALGRRTGTADALVFALSTEEVSGVLRYANENGIPVTPRGAGTNLVGSTIPLFGGIILDVSRMNRVLELDRDTMTITVEPGMLLKDLQAYVEEHGLFYPPDPGEKASSIGGNISTNAGGMRAVKVRRNTRLCARAGGRSCGRHGAESRRQAGEGRERTVAQAPAHRLGGHAGGHHQVPAAPSSQAGDHGERARAVC